MLVEAAQEATRAAASAAGGDAEETALGWLASFFAAHGRPLAGVATAERTAALIRRGFFSAREARVAGFPLTDEDAAEARRQPTGHETFCLANAAYFVAIRGRRPADRIRREVPTIEDARAFAAEFNDGRTMIYAITGAGNSAHIENT